MDTQRTFLSLLHLCLLGIVAVTGQVEFLSTPQIKSASIGETVVFQCEVNLVSATVEWWFVDHNQQLTNGTDILVPADSNYALVRPQGVNNQWNLQISPVTQHAQGKYECRVKASTLKQESSLTVTDAKPTERPPPEEIPHVDYTKCCLANNISSTCAPACNPSLLPTLANFNPKTACGANNFADLQVLVKCGTDNRNHVPCCRRRMVTDECLDWCVGGFGATGPMCLMQAEKIVGCYEEGQLLLPSAPQFVQANIQGPNLLVTWEAPHENADTVTGYKVFYRKSTEQTWNSTGVTELKLQILDRLEPAQLYELYVMAINPHGSSLPSYRVEILTPSNSPSNPDEEDGGSLLQCCKDQHMSTPCVDYLCNGRNAFTPDEQASVYGCITELDSVFTCLGGQKDHESCCMRKNLPTMCLPLCRGEILAASFQTALCIDYLPAINTCAQENKDIIPSPPMAIQLSNVTENTAALRWYSPSQHAELVTEYQVLLQEKNTDWSETYTTKAFSIVLSQLKPGTLYEVRVASVGARGSSVPTPGVIFLTYQSSGSIHVNPPTTVNPPTPAPPHDIAACCDRSGVQDQCKVFCDYDLELDQMEGALETALACEKDLGKSYQCAAAGRNHTDCCQLRGLPDVCLSYCAFGPDEAANFRLDFAHAECLDRLEDVLQCLQEGLLTVPSQVQALYVQSSTSNSVSLDWTQPASNADKVTGYRVHYRQLGEDEEDGQQSTPSSTMTEIIVQNLQPDTDYEFVVVALADKGTSLPSYGISVRTKQAESVHFLNVTVPTDLTACCRSANVSASCIQNCASTSVLDLHTCGSEIGKLVTCAADGQDHSECCSRRHVPSKCHDFCRGKPKVEDFGSLLCVTYTEQILACFREGHDYLPYEPQYFHLQAVMTNSITVAWEANPKNVGNVVYELYHKKRWDSAFVAVENVSSPYTLGGLEPLTHYNIYVIALNNYGASLPSPTMTVWTAQEIKPDITITMAPDNQYLKEFQSVTLVCRARATPAPTVHWILPHQQPAPTASVNKDISMAEYRIDSVKRTDTGRYVCVADNGVKATKDIYLKVQFALEVNVDNPRIEVEPDKGLVAELVCSFKGYPDSVNWHRDGGKALVTGTNRIWVSQVVFEAEGIVESKVSIANVRQEDYGPYTCIGTNSNGESSPKLIVLANPLEGSGQTPPTLPPAVLNLTACCMNAGVQRACQAACSFDVDISALYNLPDPLLCFQDIEKIVGCAADGKNHSLCCANKNIPNVCLPYCSGIVKPDADHLGCLPHIEVIVDCMEEGNAKIPSAPRAVQATLTSHGYIQVRWDAPEDNADYVTNYIIFYRNGANGPTLNTTLSQSKIVNLNKINSYTKYYIYVVASNHHGQSANSQTVMVETYEMLPSPPRNLAGQILDDERTLHLTWDAPAKFPGAVFSYVIYYSIAGQNKYREVSTDKLTYDLTDLLPGVVYNIHVGAKTKHLETDKSNEIVKTIPGDKGKSSGQSGAKKIGMGIGIAILFIVVFVVVGVAGWFYYKRRMAKPQTRFDDSVAFENPGYHKAGDYKITGLPSGNGNEGATAASNGKQPLPEDDPAVMSGQDGPDPYSNLGARSGPDSSMGQCATIDVEGGEGGADVKGVNMGFSQS